MQGIPEIQDLEHTGDTGDTEPGAYRGYWRFRNLEHIGGTGDTEDIGGTRDTEFKEDTEDTGTCK